MAANSKTKKIDSLVKLLQKRSKGLPVPPERSVLEHLIYAALLENDSFERADAAFTVLEHYFIDWNEIRVSTIGELADTFPMLQDPKAAGERVRRSLQGVFEKTYMFDLEELRKKGKNLSQAVEFLESVPACTRFMVEYTTQSAFGGHVIPLDEASLRVFRLLGMTQVNKEGTKEEVPGLERAIPKKNGFTFSAQLHHFAAGFFRDPESTELRTVLKSIDPEAMKRSCTPPALKLPKVSIKPETSPITPAILPFTVHVDDDEFEEDPVGTEAEFIPDDSGFRSEVDLPVRYDDESDDESLLSRTGKKEKGKKPDKKEAKPSGPSPHAKDSKKEIAVPPAPVASGKPKSGEKQPESRSIPPKKESVAKKTQDGSMNKKDRKDSAGMKKPNVSPKSIKADSSKTPPFKTASPKKVEKTTKNAHVPDKAKKSPTNPSSNSKKSSASGKQPPPKSGKPPHPTSGKDQGNKSATRQLREKKPK